MSETPNLDELKALSRTLTGLLSDAQPGLATWRLDLLNVVQAISEFAGSESDGTVAMIAIPLETYEFFCRASGGKGEDAITNALRTLMEMFSV
jgi:hypothetical protein